VGAGLRYTVILLFIVSVSACAERVPRQQAEGPSASGYEFTDIRIAPAADDRGGGTATRVAWAVAWGGPTFPGVRDCTWTVTSPDGRTIGSYTDRFTSTSPDLARASLDVETSGEAADASIECSSDRVDIGEPYAYGFTHVDAEPPREEGAPWTIRYDATWEGPSASGPVSCEAQLLDDSGQPVGTNRVTIFAADGSTSGSEILMGDDPSGIKNVTGAAIVDCRSL
jgi:hypothetical protein